MPLKPHHHQAADTRQRLKPVAQRNRATGHIPWLSSANVPYPLYLLWSTLPILPPLPFPDNTRQYMATPSLPSYMLIAGRLRQTAPTLSLPSSLPFSGSPRHPVTSPQITLISSPFWRLTTVCDSPSPPPHFCHPLAAYDILRPPFPFTPLITSTSNLRQLATNPSLLFSFVQTTFVFVSFPFSEIHKAYFFFESKYLHGQLT
jgi:hypothetical protein